MREAYFLQSLSLAHNCIDADGVQTLAQYLECCPALERLDVGNNALGDRAHELLRAGTLRMLDVSYCGMTGAGAELLQHTLASDGLLEDLRLSGNELGARGAAAMGKLLKSNASLQTLAMRQCGMAQGPLTDLLAGLAANTALAQIDLRDNAFTERVLRELAEMGTHVAAELLLDSAASSFATARRAPVAVASRRRVDVVTTMGRSRKSVGQIDGSGEYAPQPTSPRTAALVGSPGRALVRSHSARVHGRSSSGDNSPQLAVADEDASSPRVPNRGPSKKGSAIKKKLDQVREKMSSATDKVVKTMSKHHRSTKNLFACESVINLHRRRSGQVRGHAGRWWRSGGRRKAASVGVGGAVWAAGQRVCMVAAAACYTPQRCGLL